MSKQSVPYTKLTDLTELFKTYILHVATPQVWDQYDFFIQHKCIKLIKSESKYIYNISISNKRCSIALKE